MIPGLLEGLPLPVVLIAPDERIVQINAAGRRLFGETVTGRHYVTALRQPALLDCIETALRLGEPAQAVYVSSEAYRDTVWQARAAPVDFDANAGRGVALSFEDTTALREAGQIRRDFVANVSHELRTPLTALLGFIETLRGAARDDPAAQERFLTIMEGEAGRMNRLIGDLLSLSRVEGQERMRPTDPVDIAGILNSVASSLRPLVAQNEVTLTVTGASEPREVPGDADQLMQVFTNLAENAIKYSGRGTEVRMTLATSDNEPTLRGSAVTVAVSDTGEGIDPVHIPRLTERFYRVDTHRSREMGGTGLGLAIVKHIVNRHRGRLKIESAAGQGSTFTVFLPLT